MLNDTSYWLSYKCLDWLNKRLADDESRFLPLYSPFPEMVIEVRRYLSSFCEASMVPLFAVSSLMRSIFPRWVLLPIAFLWSHKARFIMCYHMCKILMCFLKVITIAHALQVCSPLHSHILFPLFHVRFISPWPVPCPHSTLSYMVC